MLRLAALILLAFVLAACGTVGPADVTLPDTDTNVDVDDDTDASVDTPMYSTAYNAYNAALPTWSEFSPLDETSETPVDGTRRSFNELAGGMVHQCTTESFDLTSNPTKIVTFNPDVGALWVGSLLQGQHYVGGVGSLAELGIRERAPITLYVDKLGESVTRTVENPTAASVQQAISELVLALDASGRPVASSMAYNVVTAYSAEQTAMHLGISARYGGAAMSASFSTERKANENRVTAHFVQELFTIAIVSPQTPGEFFTDAFTQERLDEQVALGRIGPDNVPVYVAAITYGRILNFTMTSSASVSTMKRIINASYDGLTGGGSGEYSANDRRVLAESTLEVVAVGGDQEAALRVIRSGDLRDYFTTGAALSSARPISYEVHNLGDDSNAVFSEATRYQMRDCTAPTQHTLEATLSTSARTSDNPFRCGGCRTWGIVGGERTLTNGAYFLQRHQATPVVGGSPSAYNCSDVTYSNFVTIALEDGGTLRAPRTVTFTAAVHSPHGWGGVASLTCQYRFEYVRP